MVEIEQRCSRFLYCTRRWAILQVALSYAGAATLFIRQSVESVKPGDSCALPLSSARRLSRAKPGNRVKPGPRDNGEAVSLSPLLLLSSRVVM